MKRNVFKVLLAVYDLILAGGAGYIGVSMITGGYGKFPPEWMGKIPFTDWVTPGVIAVALFGAGNLAAAACAMLTKGRWRWLPSLGMGCLFLVSFILQAVLIGEAYLATGEFYLLSAAQIGLSALAAMRLKAKSAPIQLPKEEL